MPPTDLSLALTKEVPTIQRVFEHGVGVVVSNVRKRADELGLAGLGLEDVLLDLERFVVIANILLLVRRAGLPFFSRVGYLKGF